MILEKSFATEDTEFSEKIPSVISYKTIKKVVQKNGLLL